MKELQFSTEKGNFILVDQDIEGKVKLPTDIEYQELGRVKNMTEEQFAEVIDRSIHTGLFAHYVKDIPVNTYCYKSGLDSFSSLIHSLGWYLWENPQGKHPDWRQYASTLQYQQHSMDWQEAESKTLYSPVLLKKI